MIISQNSANAGGGISIDNQCNVVMTNLIVRNNTATERGGGVFAWGNVTLNLRNSEISDNSAPHAGGVFLGYSIVPQIDNCTIAGNTANDYGGGVVFQNLLENDNVILTESIVAGNSAPTGAQVHIAAYPNTWQEGNSARTTISYSNVEMDDENDYFESDTGITSWGDGMLNIDPGFVDTEAGDYRILASSFLISAGHPDSTDADGSRSDLGAYPYETDNSATVWHVSTEGSDSDGMGTESSPFKTIQAGINLANVGGTVMVAEGTYQENVIVRGSNLTVIGSGWANTILDANENGSGVYATDIEDRNFNYGAIDTFRIQNIGIVNGIGTNNNGAFYGGGIYAYDAKIELFRLNLTGNTAGEGGALAGQDSYVKVDGVFMSDNSSTGKGSAIWFRAGDFIIKNSLINDNHYVGDNDYNTTACALAFSGGQFKLINNTIANNHGRSIWAFDQNPRVLVANSILTWHDGQGGRPYFTPFSQVNAYFFNNIIKTGINTGGVFNDSTLASSFANYYFEPSFIDTAGGDYRLSDQSAAISSGRNSLGA